MFGLKILARTNNDHNLLNNFNRKEKQTVHFYSKTTVNFECSTYWNEWFSVFCVFDETATRRALGFDISTNELFFRELYTRETTVTEMIINRKIYLLFAINVHHPMIQQNIHQLHLKLQTDLFFSFIFNEFLFYLFQRQYPVFLLTILVNLSQLRNYSDNWSSKRKVQ